MLYYWFILIYFISYSLDQGFVVDLSSVYSPAEFDAETEIFDDRAGCYETGDRAGC